MDVAARVVELERLRAELVDKFDAAEGSGAAAVSRELRAVMAELAALEEPSGSVLDRFRGRDDELAPRREVVRRRGAGSERVQPKGSRRGKQTK